MSNKWPPQNIKNYVLNVLRQYNSGTHIITRTIPYELILNFKLPKLYNNKKPINKQRTLIIITNSDR